MWKVALVKYGGNVRSGDWTIKANDYESEREAIEAAKAQAVTYPKNRYTVFRLLGYAGVRPVEPPVEFTCLL